MADTDWDSLGSELYDLLGMSAHSNQLWSAWEHAKDVDHDEFHDITWQVSNDDEMWAYYNDTVKAAETAFNSFHATWMSTFYADRSNIPVLKTRAESWRDNVMTKLRNESYVLSTQSRVRESWYGPSADKYNGALATQTAAVDEFHQIATTMATQLNTTQSVLKGIMLAIKNSCAPVKDKLNSCHKDSWAANQGHQKFFENVTYGMVQFQGLQQWMSDLASNGDWKHTMSNVNIGLEDTKVRTQSFVKGWPKSTTGDMQDMNNGKQQGPGTTGAPGAPGTTPTTPTANPPSTQPDIDTNADPVDAPGGYEQESYNQGVDLGANKHDEVDPNKD